MDWNNPLIFIVLGLAALGAIWKLGNWMGGKDEFARTVGGSIETIQTDIKRIFRLLSEGDTVESSSPLRLTDLGRTISGFLEAGNWARTTAEKVASEIPKSEVHPYGIQSYCFEYVKRVDTISESLRRKVQEAAFNNGIEINKVERVLAIELRDVLLKRFGLEAPEKSD